MNIRWPPILLTSVVFVTGCASVGEGHQYGCWCGKNTPAEGSFPLPIDPWDAACKSHDLCYGENGIDDPRCDIEFTTRLRELEKSQGRMPGQLQAAYDFFQSRRIPNHISVDAEFTLQDLDKRGMVEECAQRS